MTATERCEFCGMDVYLDAAEHPCCTFARAVGWRRCPGCSAFLGRWERGETCPHVTGKARACCHPSAVLR